MGHGFDVSGEIIERGRAARDVGDLVQQEGFQRLPRDRRRSGRKVERAPWDRRHSGRKVERAMGSSTFGTKG